ncbi:MAG TPA: ChaN family lipoprotein [Acidobacteriota bacterium]
MKKRALEPNGNLLEKTRFLQREIAALQRQIFGDDKNSRSRYVREFTREFSRHESIVSRDELDSQIDSARLIYVGDYHALPQSQHYAAELLERTAKQFPVVLGTEVFYTRNQAALDQYVSGQISEQAFLRRIRFSLEWGYDWKCYSPIIDVCRRLHIPICGVDSPPRNDLRMIARRDAAAARKIVDMLHRWPKSKVVVIFGEAHLASSHLPEKVNSMLGSESGKVTSLTILQNIDKIYWQLSREGIEDSEQVRIRPGVYCVFNSNPFLKYESYYRALERWKGEMGAEGEDEICLTTSVYNLIDVVAKFIRVDKFQHSLEREGGGAELFVDAYPEIYSQDEAEDFPRILSGSGLRPDEIEAVIAHVKIRGSCYVARANAIFLGAFDPVHAAEEAAHFVNFACKGERHGYFRRTVRSRSDLFYVQVMEECLGYFGSKLIDPTRDHLQHSIFRNPEPRNLRQQFGLHRAQYRLIRQFLESHTELELRYRKMREIPPVILKGINASGHVYSMLVHELGYSLGERLYQLYLKGKTSRAQIGKMFFLRFEQPFSALDVYVTLAGKYARLESRATAAATQELAADLRELR